MAHVYPGSGAITAGTLSSALSSGREIESLAIYPAGTDVTITWFPGEANEYTSTVLAAMAGHTYVATNGDHWNSLPPFRIETACAAGWIAF